MDDIRWFAPNHYCALPVPTLRESGLRIALNHDAPARVAVAADGQCAVEAFEYAERHRCPLVLYLWDLPPWRLGRGHPDYVFLLRGRVRRLPRPGDRYPERAGYYSRLRFVARRAEEVWCPSENTVRDVQGRFRVSAERVPFCYDSSRFRDVTSHRSPGTRSLVSLLSVSRLVAHKNLAVILRAAAHLDPRPEVTFVGQGPEAAALRGLARELGVTLHLTDTWASDDEVVAAYRAASVVVCPSRFEGFGLTPLEGLAMGVPVVASDIPAHREFVSGAVHFFPPENDKELAGALTEAIAPAGGQPSPSGTSQPAVLSSLTIEACAARFLPGLTRLLEARR